jgi:hypothetical protein
LAHYNVTCSRCHAAGSIDVTALAVDLAGKRAKLVSNLGAISFTMGRLTLMPRQILDLIAFLTTLK